MKLSTVINKMLEIEDKKSITPVLNSYGTNYTVEELANDLDLTIDFIGDVEYYEISRRNFINYANSLFGIMPPSYISTLVAIDDIVDNAPDYDAYFID